MAFSKLYLYLTFLTAFSTGSHSFAQIMMPTPTIVQEPIALEDESIETPNIVNEQLQHRCFVNGDYWNSRTNSCDTSVTCGFGETALANVCVDMCNPRGIDSQSTSTAEYDPISNSCTLTTATVPEFEGDGTCIPGIDCPDPEPTVSFTDLETCRNRGYTGDDCSNWSSERQADEAQIEQRRQELEVVCTESESRARANCTQYVQSAQQASAGQGSANNSSGFGELACSIVEQGQAAAASVSQLQSSCESVVSSCNSVCNRSVDVLWTSVSVNDSRCGQSVQSELSQPFIAQSSSLQASISSSQSTCLASREEETQEVEQATTASPTGNSSLQQATQLAAIGAQLSATSGAGELSGGQSGSSYSAGSSSNLKSSYSTYGNGSNSEAGSARLSDYQPTTSANSDGVPDESVFPNGQTNTNGTSQRQASNRAGVPNGGNARAGGFGGANSSARLGANSGKKGKRHRSAKARNLISGYKTVKASDGGGSLSIKPIDFKKYGATSLKKKLADARSKHGKDLPLIFRNGKFVLDFLAMKDSKAFKARTSAMESYLKGGVRDVASAKNLNIHQNPKLNIFKIMNFRYHRQDLN